VESVTVPSMVAVVMSCGGAMAAEIRSKRNVLIISTWMGLMI
jgi:hypothetical protein